MAPISDVKLIKLPFPAEHPLYRHYGFEPGRQVLPAGHVRFPGSRALPTDIIFERDTPVPMRDGVKIYTDVFRPTDSDNTRVPAIIQRSPYGKAGSGVFQYDSMALFRAGVPISRTSGYEKFEAPDPAEWCERGYAIINVVAHGAGHSEGNIAFWGAQEAEDIYHTVEWLIAQPWCNGSVGMMGNPWLAIAQINFASRFHHPAVKALTPMAALNEPYRQLFTRGGIPHNFLFHKLLVQGFAGPNCVEALLDMLHEHPLYDDFWMSEEIQTENIGDVPLYILASYSTGVHSQGSFDTYRTAKTARKWLRVHPYQEWFDLFRPESNDELLRFFDGYCKDIQNGWEEDVPPVRLSLLGFENSLAKAVTERPEQEWPLSRQQLRRFYLDVQSKTLGPTLSSTASLTLHEALTI